MHVRGERGDEDSPLSLRDDLAEGLAHQPLRTRHARPLRVGRVAEQQIDAAVADLGEPADIGAQAVDGRVVELPVAGVQHPARVGLEHDSDGIRYRVRHPDELRAESSELELSALGLELA